MEIRHNTAALERAIELLNRQREAASLAAHAEAVHKLRQTEVRRRLATGLAVAVAAIGIGLGIYFAKIQPVADTLPPVVTQGSSPEKGIGHNEAANQPVPEAIPNPQPEAKSKYETINFSIFKYASVPSSGRTWQVSAGHEFATQEDQSNGKWRHAWCYTDVVEGKLDVKISLGERQTPDALQSNPEFDPQFAQRARLSSRDIETLARNCPWLDGRSFNVSSADVPAEAGSFNTVGLILNYTGKIDAGFSSQLEKYNFTTLVINSEGGLVDEALSAGRWLRSTMKTVRTDSKCFSACVFVLAGGATREASPVAEIGVHRFRMSNDAAPGDVELGQSKSAEILKFFQDGSVNQALWFAMTVTPSTEILVIPHDKLEQWNLISSVATPVTENLGKSNLDGNIGGEVAKTDEPKVDLSTRLLSWVDHSAPGGDIAGPPFNNIDIGACENLCVANSQCMVATYNNKQRICSLKSELLSVRPFPGVTTLYRQELRERITNMAEKM